MHVHAHLHAYNQTSIHTSVHTYSNTHTHTHIHAYARTSQQNTRALMRRKMCTRRGVYVWKNKGCRYEGDYVDGLMHGEGEFRSNDDGSVYVVYW